MKDYSYNQPWDEYTKSIKSVIIEDGITSIGNYAVIISLIVTDND